MGDFLRKFLDVALEPFSGNFAHAAVKIGTNSVQVDADDNAIEAHHPATPVSTKLAWMILQHLSPPR
jgi:hypothetical protein